MKGFTLIEVVVSVGISILLLGVVIVNYNTHNDTQTLKQTALTLKNNLRFVQSKALSGEKPTANCTELIGWTITFTGGAYAIRAQCAPEGLQDSITSISLPSGVTISPVPAALTFGVLSQGTTLGSSVAINLVGFAKTYRITVSPGGNITDAGFQ